jgi:hypothetical protein
MWNILEELSAKSTGILAIGKVLRLLTNSLHFPGALQTLRGIRSLDMPAQERDELVLDRRPPVLWRMTRTSVSHFLPSWQVER